MRAQFGLRVGWSDVWSWVAGTVRYLSRHSGVPMVVVAAVLVVVGYRVLKKTARFAVEVALIAVLLVVASQLGWLRW